LKQRKLVPNQIHVNDIFSGLDRIDDKIASCIKLVEEILNSGRFGEQEELGFKNPRASKEYNP